MKACVAAAVSGLVHLGAAWPPAERWIVHDAPLGRRCVNKEQLDQTDLQTQANQTIRAALTRLGLLLAL